MTRLKTTLPAVIWFIAFILLSHAYAPEGYNWRTNTISDLGSQGLPRQWIMQAGFIGFGLLLTIGFGAKFIRAGSIGWVDVPVLLYGLCVLVTGFYSAAPILPGMPTSQIDANIHSVFATLAGLLFTLGIALRIFTATNLQDRWVHVTFLVLVTACSAAFGLAENNMAPIAQGVAQRALYLVSFVWLVVGVS